MGPVGAAGGGGAKKEKKVKKGKKGAAAPVIVDKGDQIANHQAWGEYPGAENWRHMAYDHNPGVILFNVKAYIHAVGNLHVFIGPDDFNGYGYFYVRLYW